MWTHPLTRKLNRRNRMSDTPNANEAADSGLRLTACSPSLLTPETDANEYGGSTFKHAPDTVRLVHADHARKLERERDAMRDWIMTAAPMLSVASCIVIDEAMPRFSEIAGCQGILEMCPVDFVILEKVKAHPRAHKPQNMNKKLVARWVSRLVRNLHFLWVRRPSCRHASRCSWNTVSRRCIR